MDKQKANYIVDILILIAFIIVAVTGILKWPAIVGIGGGIHKSALMIQLTTLHDFSGLAAIILAFLHVALNWKLLVCLTKRYFGKKEKKCN